MSHLIRRLWRHIDPSRRKQLSWVLITMLIASFAEVVSIGAILPFLGVLMAPEKIFSHSLMQPVITILGISKAHQLSLPLTVIFILAALFSGAMRLVLLWTQTRLGFAIGADISIGIYKKTLFQPYDLHVTRNSSKVIATISSKTDSVIGGVILPVLTVVSSTFILITILATLIFIDPMVALASFGGFGALYGLIVFSTRRRLRRDSQLISRESSQVIKALQEGLGGIRDVLIDGAQATYCRIYQEADLPMRKSQANVQIIVNAPRFLIESIGIALISILAYFLASRDGIATAIPMLGALAIGSQRLLPVLQQLYASWSNIQASKAPLAEVLGFLDQPIPEYAYNLLPAPLPFAHSIHLAGIGFRYASNTPWVLRDIELNIPRGCRIGFVGTTGSGKSTLLDLVMGLLQPTEGVLLVDQVPITNQNHRAWQAHIAHVPQTIFLADTTIAENIAFGIPLGMINLDRVREVAHKAQIGKTIESWERRYETVVGERGILLSGGQRQRIGIARALYKKADVIVFDEATSALDNQTEGAIMDAIEHIDRDITILIVAHRLSTLKGCHKIVDLEFGRVKWVGSYAEL